MQDPNDKQTSELFINELEEACAIRAGLTYHGPDKRLRVKMTPQGRVYIMLLNSDMDNFKTLDYPSTAEQILEEENVYNYDGYETVMWGIGSNNDDLGRHHSGYILIAKYKSDNPHCPVYDYE